MNSIIKKYNFNFSADVNQYIHKLMSDETFLAFGLELSEIKVIIENEDTFELKEMTFAYFNPIENAIHINIDHSFFTKEKSIEMIGAKILFILLHEAHHKILMHTQRKAERDQLIFNMAADFEIHNLLSEYYRAGGPLQTEFANIGRMLKSWDPKYGKAATDKFAGCYDSKYDGMMAEAIYEDLVKDNHMELEESMPFGNMEGENPECQDGQGTVNIYKDKYGRRYVEIKFNGEDAENGRKNEEAVKKERTNSELKKKMLEQGFSKNTNLRGEGSEKFQKLLNDIFKVKIDWAKILKASIHSVLAKSDYFTWRKPRAISSMLDMYLPSIEEDESKYGTLLLALDESGSMSDDDVAKAFSVIRDAKEYYKQIYFIEHDEKIVEKQLISELDEKMKPIRHAGGGTSHKEVFEEICKWDRLHNGDAEQQISAVILITDGDSDIEMHQDRLPSHIPMIYLTSNSNFGKKIKGKVIHIK